MRQAGRRIASTSLAALAVFSFGLLTGGPAAVGGSLPKCHGIPATVVGTRHADLIRTGSGRDVVVGGGGDDVIHAGSGRDIVCGNRGIDSLLGNGTADHLFGGKGLDLLFGGKGNDQLFGQSGGDWLDGGPQRDRCVGGKPGRDASGNSTPDFATGECEVTRGTTQL